MAGKKETQQPKAPAAGDNAVEQRWVKEIERHLKTLESMKGSYMNECQKVRELIADCYDRAKNAGLPKRALKGVIKIRQLEKKAAAIREDLAEDDLVEDFDRIRSALGPLADTPLGGAALAKAPAPAPSPLSAALAQEDDFDKIGKENAAKISAGIKPLPN